MPYTKGIKEKTRADKRMNLTCEMFSFAYSVFPLIQHACVSNAIVKHEILPMRYYSNRIIGFLHSVPISFD